MYDAELGCASYNLFRNDRHDRGGGVLIAVKKQIVCEQINTNSINGIEQLFLKLILSNNISLIIGCVYISLSVSIDSYSGHCDLIESIALKFVDSHFLIAGDFNLNTFDWFKDTLSQNHLTGSTISNYYLNILNLKQVNNVSNINGRHFDCLFTNGDVASICPGNSLVQKADLHHPPFECTLNFFVPNDIDQPKNLSIYSFNNCNYTGISNFLVNIDFEQNLLNIPLENSLMK